MPKLVLGNIQVENGSRPYVIAEIGVNHEGNLDTAKRLIDLAKEGGAHGAKFQSYKAESLAVADSPAYWDLASEPTPTQRQLFKKYDRFNPEDYEALARHCQDVGIAFLSTPFDVHSVDFLDPLVDFFKVASADITNVPLLRAVAAKGKPVVLSTGASNLGEIDTAIAELKRSGCAQLALMHCVLCYPCDDAQANLDMIQGLQKAYPETVIGYSDHTLPGEMLNLLSAWLLGAVILEKHFTHDKTLPGNDHYHAMDVDDLKKFTRLVDQMMIVRGSFDKEPLEQESPARLHARRSIVVARKIAKDHVITADDLTTKRPAHGISPLHWDSVLGSVAAHDLEEDRVLAWSDLA